MLLYSLRPPWPNQTIERKALLRFTELRYRLAINQPARISARLAPPADVALNDLIELVRDGEREALAYVTEISSDGVTLGVEAVGVLGILGWRHVLYFAGTERSYFTNIAAETLIKTIVATNLGSQALTTQGRLVNGAVGWFLIEADAGRGPVIASRGCAWRNVLDECVELAEQARADLTVAQVGNALELRYIPRPSSPTPSHIFSPSFGNVDSYELRRIAHEANRVVVAGQGEGTGRQYAIAALSGGPPPLREHVKHATWDGAQLNEEAQTELVKRQPKLEVRWRAAQTVGSRYWRDYRLGDYVRVQIEDYDAIHRITAVAVSMSGVREDIELETAPIP